MLLKQDATAAEKTSRLIPVRLGGSSTPVPAPFYALMIHRRPGMRGLIHERINDCFPSPSVQVPCVIGQLAPWLWHRPGFGEKLSSPFALWGSSGKLS